MGFLPAIQMTIHHHLKNSRSYNTSQNIEKASFLDFGDIRGGIPGNISIGV